MKTLFMYFFILAATCLAQTQPTSNTVIPSGVQIDVRVNDSLSSATAQSGDRFSASLINSIDDDNGNVIFPKGSTVSGRVISAQPSGRLSDSGQLVLSINSIRSDSLTANLTVNPRELRGASHGTSNATKIGGGAILGAIIGGLAGGGRGAAIGAGAGSAAGAGAAAATGKKEARVDPETILHFVTSTDTTAVANGSAAAHQIEQDAQTGSVPYSPPPYVDPGSDNDPDRPVLKRRDGSVVDPTSSNSSNQSGSSGQTVNSTGLPPADPQPPSSTGNDSSPLPQQAGQYPSASIQTNAPPNGLLFSARDRRVINDCLAHNPHVTASRNGEVLQRNDVLSATVQQQALSLPLACENQLPALSNNLERVIYDRQIMLIDSRGRVLDLFTLGTF